MYNLLTHIDPLPWEDVKATTGLDQMTIATMAEIRIAGLPGQRKPIIDHMLGIPGSGKSTYVQKYKDSGRLAHDAVILSFDQIMESLPGYQTDALLLGAKAAFNKWEMAARAIGYTILAEATQRAINVVFDHGGATGSRHGHVNLLKVLKEQYGYTVRMHHIDAPMDICLQRVSRRSRHLDPQVIPVRHAILASLIPDYKANAHFFLNSEDETAQGGMLQAAWPASAA